MAEAIYKLNYVGRFAVRNFNRLELPVGIFFYFKVFNNVTPFDHMFDSELVVTTYTPPPCLNSNSPVIQKLHTLPISFCRLRFIEVSIFEIIVQMSYVITDINRL